MMIEILVILFVIYVIFSLSTIKYQLKQIKKHLNVKEKEPNVPNDEIEKELEKDLVRGPNKNEV
jgi:uncharacterized protein YoxC